MIYVLDTETTGLKHSHGHHAFAVGYSDENEEAQVYYRGEDLPAFLCDRSSVINSECVGHNIGFDLPFLADLYLEPTGIIHDTMIAAHVYNNLEKHKDLASLAWIYCQINNREDIELDRWFDDHGYNKDNRCYADVPLELMTPYIKADIRRTLALFKFYRSKGVIDDPAYKIEMDTVRCVSRISQRGMRVDFKLANTEFNRAIEIIADLEERAKKDYAVENIASTAQIADALFTRGGLTCTTHTAKKNVCLDETAIQKYDHPLVKMVLDHRQITKLTNTYLTAIIEKSQNGRLYSSLNQVGARTGRFSSSDPNLQNIPRNDERAPINLRQAFICSENCKLLLVDLSQIELRILAHYSKEPQMIETLKDRRGDIHTTTSIQMFGEVNEELRTVAKTLNFAVIYGAGGEALVEQLNKALPTKRVTLAQAKDFKSKFFKGYPLVQQFLWDIAGRIAERGYVQGKSGRKYYCEKDKAYRASNYLIQGESAMLMKQMMCDVEAILKNFETKLINVIHDELIFDLHNNDLVLIKDIVETIEQPTGWRVPIYANASISETSWANKRKVQ